MTLVRSLVESLRSRRERPAMVDARWRLRFDDVERVAASLAAWLDRTTGARDGLRPPEESVVALMLPNSAEFAMAFVGALAGGHVVLPVNYLLQTEELVWVLRDAAPRVLVTAAAFRDKVPALRAAVPSIEAVLFADVEGEHCREGERSYEEVLALEGATLVDRDPPAERPAMLLYTSGTSGRPKGVVLSHGNLLANLEGIREAIAVREDDVFLVMLPLFHAFAVTTTLLLPLVCGARMVMLQRFHPSTVFRSIAEDGVTVMVGVPSMYGLLAKVGLPEGLSPEGLRICIAGGEALPSQVGAAFHAVFGLPLVEGYGATECAPVVCVTPDGVTPRPASVGPPLRDVELRVVDREGRSLPAGAIGELEIRGPNVMLGYWKNAEATAEVLRDGWYRSGDLASLDEDGFCTITGRLREMIIVGGENVYPREVEDVLLRVPELQEAAVVGVPDERRGEMPVAFVVARPGAEVDGKALRAFCAENLAAYKVPRRIELRDELPKTLTGKVFKRKLLADESQGRSAALDERERLVRHLGRVPSGDGAS